MVSKQSHCSSTSTSFDAVLGSSNVCNGSCVGLLQLAACALVDPETIPGLLRQLHAVSTAIVTLQTMVFACLLCSHHLSKLQLSVVMIMLFGHECMGRTCLSKPGSTFLTF